MPQRTYTVFSGGQNTNQGEFASPIIPDYGATEALAFAQKSQNWRSSPNGLKKFTGDTAVLGSVISTTATITGLYDWNGTRVVCGGTKVYTVNISNGNKTEIYSGVTAGAFFQFTEWDDGAGNEILIMCNGTDKPLYYDGSTCTTISFTDPQTIWNDARPFTAAVFRGRIFYFTPRLALTPRPGTHNNFDESTSEVDAFTVDAGFGGDITGARALTDDMLVIYKQRCIRRLSGTDPFDTVNGNPFQLREVTNDFGCVAPRSIVQVGLDHYFLSESGVRRLQPVQSYGDIDPSEPTYAIQEVINSLNYTETVINKACAMFLRSEKQVWFSLPYGSSSTNNLVIVHDVMTGANDTTKAGDIAAACLAEVDRIIYHGGYVGQIYKHDSGATTWHGNAINAERESKFIAHNGVGVRKRYREMSIYADSEGEGTLIVQWQILTRNKTRSLSKTREISSSEARWDSAVWDLSKWASGGQQNIFKIKNMGRGNAIKLKFINQSGQKVNIRQVDLFYDLFNTARG